MSRVEISIRLIEEKLKESRWKWGVRVPLRSTEFKY